MASRYTDSELNTNFGGRSAYLAAVRKSLEEARVEVYKAGDATAAFFGQDSEADFERSKAAKIAELEAAIAVNS